MVTNIGQGVLDPCRHDEVSLTSGIPPSYGTCVEVASD